MKKLLSVIMTAGILVISSTSALTADESINGIQAFQKGQYQTALRLLIVDSENGSTKALYALGLMHEYGLGVTTSPSQAAGYYFKGAKINTRKNRQAEARVFASALERTAY